LINKKNKFVGLHQVATKSVRKTPGNSPIWKSIFLGTFTVVDQWLFGTLLNFCKQAMKRRNAIVVNYRDQKT
jgi:hypothetical protein